MTTHQEKTDFFMEHLAIYEKDLHKILFILTESVHDADDLTQQTMEKAWKKLEQLKNPSSAKLWLIAIAKNESRQFFRSKKRSFNCAALLEDPEDLNEIEEDMEDIADFLCRRTQLDLLLQALESLPRKQKQFLYLRFFENLPQKDVCLLLDIPAAHGGTVQQRAVQALYKQYIKSGGTR